MTDLTVGISDAMLRSYPRPVAKILGEAINQHGVKYRDLDGRHMFLYNGEKNTQINGTKPFKVAASRAAEYTLQYLEVWLEESFESWRARNDKPATPADLAALVEHLTTSTEKLEALHAKPEPEPVIEVKVEPKEWWPYKYGFEQKAGTAEYRCTATDCGYEQRGARGLHLHARKHLTPDEAVKPVKKATSHRRDRTRHSDLIARQAIQALATVHGVTLGADPEVVEGLQKALEEAGRKQAELVLENDRLTAQVSDLEARLARVQEAMK